MTKIIKNCYNQIWLKHHNNDIKILKYKESSNTNIITQDGLVFWGRADSSLLNIINGNVVSEAYDVRYGQSGQYKMWQDVNAFMPKFVNNSISFVHNSPAMLSVNKSVPLRTAFLIIKTGVLTYDSNNRLNGLGSYNLNPNYNYWLGIKTKNNDVVASWNSSPNQLYVNNQLGIDISINSNTMYILHSVNPSLLDTTVNWWLGSAFTPTNFNVNIYEWGWYNRELTSEEILHNINTLNVQYNVF